MYACDATNQIIRFHSCASTPTPCVSGVDIMTLAPNSSFLTKPITNADRYIQKIGFKRKVYSLGSLAAIEYYRGQRFDRLKPDGTLWPVHPSPKAPSYTPVPSVWEMPEVFTPISSPPRVAPPYLEPFVAPGAAEPFPQPMPYYMRPLRRLTRHRVRTERWESGPQKLPEPSRMPDVHQWPDNPHTDKPPKERKPRKRPRPRVRPRPGRPTRPQIIERDDYPTTVEGLDLLPWSNSPVKVEWQAGERVPASPPVGREPPTRLREKQRKFTTKTYAIGRAIMHVLNTATEVKDFIEALFQALPRSVKVKYRGKANPLLRGLFVFEHIEQLDVDLAIRHVVANQIEDMLYGKLGQLSSKASHRLGSDPDIIGRAYRRMQELGYQPDVHLDPLEGVLDFFDQMLFPYGKENLT